MRLRVVIQMRKNNEDAVGCTKCWMYEMQKTFAKRSVERRQYENVCAETHGVPEPSRFAVSDAITGKDGLRWKLFDLSDLSK